VLGEVGLVQVVLCLLEIPQETLRLLGVLHHLGILLVVLPLEVLPIQMEFWGGHFFFLLYLVGLADPVLLLDTGQHHLHRRAQFVDLSSPLGLVW
jgi:hypothetical protein